MDYRLRGQINEAAARSGLQITEEFYTALDAYINRHFPYSQDRDKLIIQTYLARGAIRIASAEGKHLLEAEDAKAAVWLFHLPEQPDDPCATAGNRALAEEARRGRHVRGLLTESFANFLDQT